MSRNAKNAPGAWGRRAFEDEVRANTRGVTSSSLHFQPPVRNTHRVRIRVEPVLRE
jgi:hypothetical protein